MKSSQSRIKSSVLLASPYLGLDSAYGRAAQALQEALEQHGFNVLLSTSSLDACAALDSTAAICCVLVNWDLSGEQTEHGALEVLAHLRNKSPAVPAYILADRQTAADLPRQAMEMANDFIWMLEDTPSFISGRINRSIRRYLDQLLPPMFESLVKFSQVHEYSWHTPGHTGGTAFLKSPVGRAFFDFYGENMLRSDLSISVGELGSLLDHSGPIGEGERYAARVFGADRTYYVTNGSSTSNRVIMMASATRNQVALCDRNCHKSVEHAITLSGALPTYLMPSRNAYGIIGPIPPERLKVSAIHQSIADNPLNQQARSQDPVHLVITNSTYDGLCYNVRRVESLLDNTLDRLHFDEAWFGYARFNPLYQDRYAMYRGAGDDHDGPTVFATQSTHKLLAALSQASMIHIRDGRSPIEHDRFNEAFMMHASTSPQYSIIASNDVSAAMMEGAGGEYLTGESIREAIAFRQMIGRLNHEYADKGEWFFAGWQPPEITDPLSGETHAFHEAPAELLASAPECWTLKPNARWHGFGDLEEGYCMLDPIKVSIVTPGMDPVKGLQSHGIPAALVTAYLGHHGIVVEKTTDFTLLFLFSIGITKGKWGTLINSLLAFKRHYDANTLIAEAIPPLCEASPRYAQMGLKDLADEMFQTMQTLRSTESMSQAFSSLPQAVLSPSQAYEHLVANDVEKLPLSATAGRVVATGIVPYPPGIPVLMPGESMGEADGAVMRYLKALEAFDQRFPGFTHDNHGVEVIEGEYHIYCLKPEALATSSGRIAGPHTSSDHDEVR